MNSDVKKLLSERNSAFRSSNEEAKAAYGKKLEGHFNESDPQCVWQGIQQLTNYKGNKGPTTSNSSNLLAELNHFFARFELSEVEPAPALRANTNDLAPTVSTGEVRRVLRSINPSKAAGPYGIPGRVLRDCADQLAEVLNDIFNLSLSTCTVPRCVKKKYPS